MKNTERIQALALRRSGNSIKFIADKLNVSKSTVSSWVRDVPLSVEQKKTLSLNGRSVEIIERNRVARIRRTMDRRNKIMEIASEELGSLSKRDLWLLGIALYWGEGGKAYHGSVRLSNSDPDMIKFMMRFFREACGVPESKFRGHVHTYSNTDVQGAEKYWSRIAAIPISQFYKSYVKQVSAETNRKKTLPYGTFQIYVCDTVLFFRIRGWIERVKSLSGAEE